MNPPDLPDPTTPILQERTRRLYANLPRALSGSSEHVHQMRVAARRLRVTLPLLARKPEGRRVRRVSDIAVLEPLGTSYDRCSIAGWRRDGDTFDALRTPAEIDATARRLRLKDHELLEALHEREQFLTELLESGVSDMGEVQRRVFAFRGYHLVE